MTSNLGEVTPLVGSTTGASSGEWQPVYPPTANPRRRGFLNHDEETDFPSGTFDPTYHYQYGQGGGGDATKGQDRRTYWNRFKETLSGIWPVVKGQVRANTANACSPLEKQQGATDAEKGLICSPVNETAGTTLERTFYEDTYNDESWACTFGTDEDDGIWLNVHDRVGTIMSSLVWILVIYSGITVGLLSQHNHLSPILAKVYFTICALALASHAKTTFTDPGAIPLAAVPVDVYTPAAHAMCSRCQSYKPKGTHHCRICDRCISGMDHHCPWMNNCVGTGNMKHFVLFLCYTWIACAFALLMFGWNYFFCADEECTFSPVLIQLVRVMTLMCIATLIFTSSMLTNVTFGVITGVGTIDRLKLKADNAWGTADDEPMDLKDIFGIGDYWTWPLPFFDPVFEDYDLAMGYSTPQRLLRERA